MKNVIADHPHLAATRKHIEASCQVSPKRNLEKPRETQIIFLSELPLSQDSSSCVNISSLSFLLGHSIYASTEAPLTQLNIPFDGTCTTSGILNLHPTSRGSVTLASTDPAADPLIDPNCYETEADNAQSACTSIEVLQKAAHTKLVRPRVICLCLTLAVRASIVEKRIPMQVIRTSRKRCFEEMVQW